MFMYLETYAEAEKKRESMRSKEPALYNIDRLSEQPIPVCEFTDSLNDQQISEPSDHGSVTDGTEPNDLYEPFDWQEPIICQELDFIQEPVSEQLPITKHTNFQRGTKKHPSGKRAKIAKPSKTQSLRKRMLINAKFKKFHKNAKKSTFIETDNNLAIENDNSNEQSVSCEMGELFVKPEPVFQPMDIADEQAVETVFSEWQHGDDEDISVRFRSRRKEKDKKIERKETRKN